MSKSLAIIKKKPSRALVTREAQIIDLPEKAVTVRRGGELTVQPSKAITVKKGDTNLTVRERGQYGENEPSSSGRSQSSETASKGGGRLVRLDDAIAAGADAATITAKVLSWGNKRKNEKLADGGQIRRRLGGTGYGGAQNATGNKRAKLPSDTRTTEDRLREIRERDLAKRKASGEKAPKPMLLKEAKRQMAIEDKQKPLMLGDGKKDNQLALVPDKPLAKPDRTALDRTTKKMGLAAQPDAAPVAPQIDAGTVQRTKKAIEDSFAAVNADTAKRGQMSPEKQREVNARKNADVKAALKKFQFARAADLLLTKYSDWATPEDFDMVDAAAKRALK